MHTLKLINTFIKVNLQIALAYRVDTVINILLNAMWLVWELFSLSIIFNNTSTLGGGDRERWWRYWGCSGW